MRAISRPLLLVRAAVLHMNSMRDILRALPLTAEFTLVIGISFGYAILGSLAYVWAPPDTAPITEGNLLFLVIYELTVMLVVFWFLKQRDWKFDDFKLQPSLRATGYGILLAISAYTSYIVLWGLALSVSPGSVKPISQVPLVSNNISIIKILAVSIVNPLFEELLVVGYVITALKQVKGVTYAINISVAIRLLYHLYQGPLGVIFIIPLGLIFAYWYAKKERLWSVVIAHALLDFFGLYVYQ